MKIVKIVLSVIWIVMCLIASTSIFEDDDMTFKVFYSLYILCMLILPFAIYKAVQKHKLNKNTKITTIKPKQTQSTPQEPRQKDIVMSAKHFDGLSVPKNAVCILKYTTDKIIIISGRDTYNLNLDKVKNIEVITHTNTRNELGTSFVGAAFGAAVGGWYGARIFGLKRKKVRTINHGFVITYQSDHNTARAIRFTNPSYKMFAFEKRFNKNNPKPIPQNRTIEL